MEKFKIKGFKFDILSKAPSLDDVENYNILCLRKSNFFLLISAFLFINTFMMVAVGAWIPVDQVLLTLIKIVFFFSFFFSFIFLHIGLEIIKKREVFLSLNKCPHLANLISKYPEVASYRAQIVVQGREFFEGEYAACVRFEEKIKCAGVYSDYSLVPLEDKFLGVL